MTDDAMIAALLRERESYVQRGLPERIAQVDEQLAIRGYAPPADAPADKPVSRTSAPKGRRQAPRETT